jgi:SAM-dependent methyltransferase
LDTVIDSYVGVEPSETELSRFHLKEKRFLIRGTGEHLEFVKSDSFDLVLLVSVLDHCINWKHTLSSCWRVLRPGGLVIISMESVHNLLLRFKSLLGCSLKHDHHAHFLGLPEILEELGDNFAVKRQFTFGYGFGWDRLTRRLPIPKWVFSNFYFPLADRSLMHIFPGGGQHLFCAAIKVAPDSACAKRDHVGGLCCPRCNYPLIWGARQCSGCGLSIPFTGSMLDSIELGKTIGIDFKGL